MKHPFLLTKTLAVALVLALCCGIASAAQDNKRPKTAQDTAAQSARTASRQATGGNTSAGGSTVQRVPVEKVPRDVASNLNSRLGQLAGALRTVCAAGKEIVKTRPADPQFKKLLSDLEQLDTVSFGPLKLVDSTQPDRPSILTFSQFCVDVPKPDSPWIIADPGSAYTYYVSKGGLKQTADTVKNLGKFLQDIVDDINASDDLAKAADGADSTFSNDLQTAWSDLKAANESLGSIGSELAVKLDNLPKLKSPASTPLPPPGSSLSDRLKSFLDRFKSSALLPLTSIALNLALLCILLAILIKIRKREVVELNGAQAKILDSTRAQITTLSENVSNLSTSVASLKAALEASVETPPLPPPPSSPPPPPAQAEEENEALAKFKLWSSTVGTAPADQQASLAQLVASVTPKPLQPSDPPSGDLVVDYNSGRTSREMEQWFQKQHQTTPVSCQNLHLAHSSAITLRFEQDPKGNFLVVTEGGATSAFPSFRRNLDLDFDELQGVFTYLGSHEPLRLVKAAKLREIGIGEWELAEPGEIQNG